MHKIITEIKCPKEWEIEDDYSSHRPILWLCCQYVLPFQPITELGCGEGSTKLLYNFKKEQGDNFVSYETNQEYVERYKKYTTKVDNYLEIDLLELPFKQGLLFIDCAPGEIRKDLIEKHKNHTDCIVVHDTEEGALDIYGIREVLNSFKYRLDFMPKGMPGTTAISNFIDVTKYVI